MMSSSPSNTEHLSPAGLGVLLCGSICSHGLFFLLLLQLGLLLACLLLLSQCLGLQFFSLCLMDCLDKHALVFELITLGAKVELMVQMLVNLFGIPVFSQQPAKNPSTSHPQYFHWHPCLSSSTPLANSSVPTLALSFKVLADTCT